MKRLQIRVTGIVQGVGFRPFIFRLAKQCQLSGWVLNHDAGVVMEIEGPDSGLQAFLKLLSCTAPPRSRIESLDTQEIPVKHEADFKIKISLPSTGQATLISPDIAVCEDCLSELRNPLDYRRHYPFINCTNCGPRFTIIKALPYDRASTTMSEFTMCPVCDQEYHNPETRRFHAQPNACGKCGPKAFIYGRKSADPIAFAGKELAAGKIIAVKGLGGFHLACDATNPDAVRRLRGRKAREGKPFALMVKDLESLKTIAILGPKEREYLSSWRRPIVLVEKSLDSPLAGAVAPGQNYLGVMLPYTPLHYLLFDHAPPFLIMTSANWADAPIIFENSAALQELRPVADYFLMHDREIYTRCDDSVARIFKGKPYLIRRSRGYAPDALPAAAPCKLPVLGCGAELKHTFCLAKDRVYLLSPHIGDLKNPENLEAFKQALEHYTAIFKCRPRVLAHDLHPQYLSTQFALAQAEVQHVAVQHHFAHLGSVLAEHRLNEKIIAATFDGAGLGEDGAIWGGEWLIGDLQGFSRAAHLSYVPLLGGDQAAYQPWRMALAHLYPLLGNEVWKLGLFNFLTPSERQLLQHMLTSPATLRTSSLGRLFDAVSALTGLGEKNSYEGEAAMLLEMAAVKSAVKPYGFNLNTGRLPFTVKLEPMWEEILADRHQGKAPGEISARFHHTMAKLTVEVCRAIREYSGIAKVGLSGGVWQNVCLLENAVEQLEQAGFKVYLQRKVPPNDGGIALGQAAIAAYKL